MTISDGIPEQWQGGCSGILCSMSVCDWCVLSNSKAPLSRSIFFIKQNVQDIHHRRFPRNALLPLHCRRRSAIHLGTYIYNRRNSYSQVEPARKADSLLPPSFKPGETVKLKWRVEPATAKPDAISISFTKGELTKASVFTPITRTHPIQSRR